VRAAVFYGREDLRIEDVPEPAPGPGQVKLRVGFNGLCGSDLHEFYAGPRFYGSEMVIGHEFSGEVVELGAGVSGLVEGDRVAAEPLLPCGACHQCQTGEYHVCRRSAMQGCNAPGGGLAEYAVIRADKAHILPQEVGLAEGALVEPLAVAEHGVSRAAPSAEELVVVHGAGPIGVGVFLALRARGVERIVVAEPSAQRAAVLRELGGYTVLDPANDDVNGTLMAMSDGDGATLSIDAAGVQASFDAAVRGTAKQGRILLLATYGAPVSLNPNELVMSERHVLSSKAYRSNDYRAVIASLASGRYPTESWVQHVKLADVVDAGLRALRDQRAMKVLVDVRS
jgi:(R,R)-butanediol dehydrogenase/meso-butanediol dehydrogenase/diacetyl reductase